MIFLNTYIYKWRIEKHKWKSVLYILVSKQYCVRTIHPDGLLTYICIFQFIILWMFRRRRSYQKNQRKNKPKTFAKLGRFSTVIKSRRTLYKTGELSPRYKTIFNAATVMNVCYQSPWTIIRTNNNIII